MLSQSELHNVLTDLVGQLKRNVDKVPLEILQTKYAKGYNALVDSIWQAGQQMMDAIFRECLPLPVKEDAADTPDYQKAADAIRAREKEAGAYDRMRAALIDRQDISEFYDHVTKLWEALFTEAWEPYMNRHCRWVGKPDNRWIYCDIFNAWWYQEPKYEHLGHWITKTGERAPIPCYKPSIGPDPMRKEVTA